MTAPGDVLAAPGSGPVVVCEGRRAGGPWPLCPRCEEDELYSHVMLSWTGLTPRPALAEVLRGGFSCYRCSWRTPAGSRVVLVVYGRSSAGQSEQEEGVMGDDEGTQTGGEGTQTGGGEGQEPDPGDGGDGGEGAGPEE